MNPLILLFKAYWMQMVALGICLFIVGLIGYQRHEINALQRDNASLQQTIDLAKAIGQAQNEKTARIEQGAHQAAILSANQYLSDLEKVKQYAKAHPANKHSSNSVCQSAPNTDSSAVSETGTSTQGTDGSTADEVASGQGIESDCTLTTLQLLHLQKFEREQESVR